MPAWPQWLLSLGSDVCCGCVVHSVQRGKAKFALIWLLCLVNVGNLALQLTLTLVSLHGMLLASCIYYMMTCSLFSLALVSF